MFASKQYKMALHALFEYKKVSTNADTSAT